MADDEPMADNEVSQEETVNKKYEDEDEDENKEEFV